MIAVRWYCYWVLSALIAGAVTVATKKQLVKSLLSFLFALLFIFPFV